MILPKNTLDFDLKNHSLINNYSNGLIPNPVHQKSQIIRRCATPVITSPLKWIVLTQRKIFLHYCLKRGGFKPQFCGNGI